MNPILTRPAKIASSKSIEDLLRRRFGTLAPSPVSALQDPRAIPTEHSQAIASARAEYESMTVVQLQGEIEKARREDIDAMKSKAAEEERCLFFHQRNAAANVGFWGKMALWTLDEAIALSLGKSPHSVNWQSVNGDDGQFILAALKNSPFRREYAVRRELANRAVAAQELSDPIRPEEFLTWSISTFDSVPSDLIEQVRKMGKHIADLHVMTERVAELEAQLIASGSRATVDVPEKPLGARERTTLLVIIGALAEAAKVDVTKPYKAGDAIAAMLNDKFVTVGGRTIGDHMRSVPEALNSRKTK